MSIIFTPINNHKLLVKANSLEQTGKLHQHENGMIYLDVDNSYIHELFPILRESQDNIIKPKYFEKEMIGAHITIAYPGETNQQIEKTDQKNPFKIKKLCHAVFNNKTYYFLTINFPPLVKIRESLLLPSKPNYKGEKIEEFHITIATSESE